MCGIRKFLSGAIFFAAALAPALLPQKAASRSLQGGNPDHSDEPVPAFHARAPQGTLPETMNPEFFTDPVVQNAYAIAAKIKKTLYQQPCYCHCDRSHGHTSLLDCFASQHGSGCGTCLYEDFYSYEQSSKGKTAAQIRAGIVKGEWETVDATKYQRPLPGK